MRRFQIPQHGWKFFLETWQFRYETRFNFVCVFELAMLYPDFAKKTLEISQFQEARCMHASKFENVRYGLKLCGENLQILLLQKAISASYNFK